MSEKILSQPPVRITAFQYLSYALTKAYFIISRSTIITTGDWGADAGMRYVIASSHVSWLDPFLATTALGWKRLRPLLPCRFIAAPIFLQKPVLRRIMIWLGAYPSHELRNMAYGLDASLTMLDRKQTVVIFPQGKRNPADKKVHRGVAVLAKHPGTLIVPVLIHRKSHAFLGMTSYLIYTGEPFDGATLSAEEIMAQVLELGTALNPRVA